MTKVSIVQAGVRGNAILEQCSTVGKNLDLLVKAWRFEYRVGCYCYTLEQST